MRNIILAAVLSLASSTAFAQTAKQIESNAKQVAKAEASVLMASCKLDWLKSHVGESRSSAAFFSRMASCLTKQASR